MEAHLEGRHFYLSGPASQFLAKTSADRFILDLLECCSACFHRGPKEGLDIGIQGDGGTHTATIAAERLLSRQQQGCAPCAPRFLALPRCAVV